MRRKKAAKGGPGKSGPVLTLPENTDWKTRRKISKLLDAELEKILGEREKRVPHLYRWRFQLVPLAWLAGACAGLVSHAAHTALATAVAAALTMVITVAATRHKPKFPRNWNQGMSAWAGCWAIILAMGGIGWWAGVGLTGWYIMAGFWLEHYRHRGPATPEKRDTSVEDTWKALAAKQNWSAWLGPPVPLAAGRRWPIICQGSETSIGQITGKPDAVAAAYDGTITTVIPEPREDGVRSRGWLTILKTNTLETARPWDGAGIDPATGLAVVGRFPEGGDAHERWYVPGIGGGTRSSIYSGADGTGKTGMLDMGLCISVGSGIVAPVILDPQMGQALPAWQEAVPYAAGTDECMAYLRGLYAGMMTRSEFLGQLRWKHPRTRRTMRGMGWYDYQIIAATCAALGLEPLPIIEIIVDEAPILLAVKGAPQLLLDIAKLGRKVGFRLRLAAQVPSMAELGKSELRSILVGGNVFAFRSGDRVSGGMMNITGRPQDLPKYFPNGEPTRGLCFGDTIESRPGVTMRTDHIEEDRLYAFAEERRVRQPDADVADGISVSLAASAARLSGLQQAASSESTRELQVLAAIQGPMRWGELVVSCSELSVMEVAQAFAGLEKAGKAVRKGDLVEPA